MTFVVNLATHLSISDVPLSTPAWEHTNIYALLSVGAVRGENVVMPGAIGRRAVRRRTDEANVTIELAIFGEEDWEGNPHADPIAGLIDNIEYLRDNLVDPPAATPTSLRPAVLTYPGGTLTADVQVLGFEITEGLAPSAVNVYPGARSHWLTGTLSMTNDSFGMALVNDSFVYEANDQYLDHVAGVIDTTPVVITDVLDGIAQCEPVVFPAVSGMLTVSGLVLFRDSGDPITSLLVAHIDRRADSVPLYPLVGNNGDLTFTFPDYLIKI
jgi:hypothetical protein